MNYMKHVAIIGAGIAGLRAGLELIKDPSVTVNIFEKSPSVGGRVATRRFDNSFVNHGCPAFWGEQATNLPKAMRDKLLKSPKAKLHTKTRVARVGLTGEIKLDNGEHQQFDHVLITAPLPQARELLLENILPEIVYSKSILFIGEVEGQGVRLEMGPTWCEEHFEKSDEELRALGEKSLKRSLHGLDVKKWRYAQVLFGVKRSYFEFGPCINIAGDAFDPRGQYRFKAAWFSGLASVEKILCH